MLAAHHSPLFVGCADIPYLQDIQRFYNTVIEELPSNVADLI
jgi:translation initiation factor 4A